MDFKYIDALLKGLIVGIPLSFALGPAFFTLIQRSIEKGFRTGVYIAIGVVLSDILLIITAFSGTKFFVPDGNMVTFYVQVACVILLMYMGVSTILKEPHYKSTKLPKENKPYYYITQGALLNILNPGNFFAWVGISTYIDKALLFDANQQIIFYTGSIIAIFTTEVLIAFSAKKLKKFLSDKIIHIINVGTGWLFIGCGIYLGYLAIDSIV